jgi:monoamine oxidase
MGESINLQWNMLALLAKNNYSGTLFSQASIIQKCTTIALLTGICIKGFLNGGTHTLSEERNESNPSTQNFFWC